MDGTVDKAHGKAVKSLPRDTKPARISPARYSERRQTILSREMIMVP